MSNVGDIVVKAGIAEARIIGTVAKIVDNGVILETRPGKAQGAYISLHDPAKVAFYPTREEAEAAAQRYTEEWHRHTDLIIEAENAWQRAIELRKSMSEETLTAKESAA